MDIFYEIISNVHALKKKNIIALGGGVLTTRPPGGLSPNQAQAASPMVFGWRLCAWFGCRRAIGDGRGQSRRPPWCAGNEFPKKLSSAARRSTVQFYVRRRKKKGRVRTRVKLVE